MIRKHSRFDPFTDLLFNILLAFTFLFFIIILFINPITKFGNINMKAEYIITVDWKDSLPDDIDLWVKDPNGEIVSYLKKDAGRLHLERDDQGIVNDKVIKKFAIKPIHIENKNNGSQNFLSGILNRQKGIKHIKTINILKLPINNGGTFSLKINFCTG